MGDPVAVVVAADPYLAEDAAEAVVVDYEPLPAIASVPAALADGAPLLHPARGANVACSFEQRVGDVEAASRAADLVLDERFATNRLTGVPLECRGLAADYDRATGRLTVWGAAKVPHFNRATLAELLGLPEQRIRLVENVADGGFGARAWAANAWLTADSKSELGFLAGLLSRPAVVRPSVRLPLSRSV